MSREFTVSLQTSGFKSDVSISQESVSKYIQSCLHESCVLVQKTARKHHDFESRTGNLERAIRFMVIKKLDTGVVYVDPVKADYGLYVHEGTGIFGPKGRKYDIFPKRVKALSFFWKRYGKWVNLKHVKHPGSRSDKFLEEALEINKSNINNIFAEGLRRLLSVR